MFVQEFLNWNETANVKQKVMAASELARTFLDGDVGIEERCELETILFVLLDDSSPKVRAAIAEVFSTSNASPAQFVTILAEDQPEVSSLILVRSPLLSDDDLINHLEKGCATRQCLIAMRAYLSDKVCDVIAQIGGVEACFEMLQNDGAHITASSFYTLAERHGSDFDIRTQLLKRQELPANARHILVHKLGDVFANSSLLKGISGAGRATKLVQDACSKATVQLIDDCSEDEYHTLVEHLRLRGELTEGLIVRTIAHGKIDFFGVILTALCNQGERRVTSLLANGRDNALKALFRSCGLSDGAHVVVLRALKIWRDVAHGKRIAGAQEVAWMMLQEIHANSEHRAHPPAENDDLMMLLKSLHVECIRDNARVHVSDLKSDGVQSIAAQPTVREISNMVSKVGLEAAVSPKQMPEIENKNTSSSRTTPADLIKMVANSSLFQRKEPALPVKEDPIAKTASKKRVRQRFLPPEPPVTAARVEIYTPPSPVIADTPEHIPEHETAQYLPPVALPQPQIAPRGTFGRKTTNSTDPKEMLVSILADDGDLSPLDCQILKDRDFLEYLREEGLDNVIEGKSFAA